MSPAEITGISCIAALVSALAALCSVWLTNEQRSASRPELLILKTSYKATVGEGWHWRRETEAEEEGNDSPRPATIVLVNVGRSPAKNISLRWSFPIDETAIVFNELASEVGAKPVAKQDRGGRVIDGVWTNWERERGDEIEFVLPAEKSRNAGLIELPFAYTQLIGGACRLVFLTRPMESSKFGRKVASSIPPLTCNIRFEDVGGKTYRAAFVVECQKRYSVSGKELNFFLRPIRSRSRFAGLVSHGNPSVRQPLRFR